MAPIHNLCSQIQNSFLWKFGRIAVPNSTTNRAICQILYEEGFLSGMSSGDETGPYQRGVEVPVTPENVARRKIWLDLKYRNGEPVLKKIRAVSIPSRRVFASVEELQAIAAARRASPLLKGQAVGQVTVLNTPYGIIELKEALKKEVGGEVLCMAA